MTFKDGATTLGTGTLTAGTATFATSALAMAGHSITAVYGGDSNFTTSTSSSLTQTVNKGATSHRGELVAEPQRVRSVGDVHRDGRATAPASGTPTGTVTFKDGATTLGTGTLTRRHRHLRDFGACGGRSHRSPRSTAATPTSRPRHRRPDADGQPGATATALGSSVNPSRVRSVGYVHRDRRCDAPASGTPTRDGDVQGRRDDARHRHAERRHGDFTTSALAVATHSITAVYGGDTNFTT